MGFHEAMTFTIQVYNWDTNSYSNIIVDPKRRRHGGKKKRINGTPSQLQGTQLKYLLKKRSGFFFFNFFSFLNLLQFKLLLTDKWTRLGVIKKKTKKQNMIIQWSAKPRLTSNIRCSSLKSDRKFHASRLWHKCSFSLHALCFRKTTLFRRVDLVI